MSKVSFIQGRRDMAKLIETVSLPNNYLKNGQKIYFYVFLIYFVVRL